jgi:hypothetical protein
VPEFNVGFTTLDAFLMTSIVVYILAGGVSGLSLWLWVTRT